MCSSATLSCTTWDNTHLAKMMSTNERPLWKALWEVGRYLSTCSCIRPRTIKWNTLWMELSRTTGRWLLNSPLGLPVFLQWHEHSLSYTVLIISPLSKMALRSPAMCSTKASPPYFNNWLGIMSVPQARWFLRVFNARSTSSGVMGLQTQGTSILCVRFELVFKTYSLQKLVHLDPSFSLLQCC